MIEATLIQRVSTNDEGTLGKLFLLGKEFFTLELPWLENKNSVSCIPEGVYVMKWTKSPRLKKFTYEILNVPKRAGIRLHGGNFAGKAPKYITHSLGCPLLGYKVGRMSGQRAILDSRRAVADFERLANKRDIKLEVKNV
jgi:hypothetical protein